ncbi:MAG: hypothetical protein M0Z95_16545 [Actinomycetota bacterium]|jgi:hypothetical protein|nr:hypothetical protein [Actinomycetota bacterium]
MTGGTGRGAPQWRSWWHSRSRIERRLIVAGTAVVLFVAIPGLRAGLVALLVGLVLLVVMLSILGMFGLVITWRFVRRHRLADLLVAAWLLRRHERHQQRIVDAQGWPKMQQPYEAQNWTSSSRTRFW